MKKKINFQCEGVPPLILMNSSKEQTLGKSCQKLRDGGCEKKTTKPYSPWKIANKPKIKELKIGFGQKLFLTNTSWCL